MKKVFLAMSVAGLLLASCGKSEVCKCADTLLELSKEMDALKGDYTKMESVMKKYEPEMKKCETLSKGKGEADEKKFENELKQCDAYKEMEKMRDKK
jgi:hypothetical protein